MSLEEIAQKVIKNAIRSAICIDDEYAPPYPQGNSGLNTEEPSKLYYSFREKGNCDLDIYHFESIEKSWKPDYMIPNKDLVILDWELDKGGNKFDSTLRILEDIVKSEKIPFVLIYTNTEDLNQVTRELISRFNPYSQDELKEFINLLVTKFSNLVKDLDEAEIEEFIEENRDRFYEHFMSFSQRSDIASEIISNFAEEFEIDLEKAQKKFNTIFKELFGEKKAGVGMTEISKVVIGQGNSHQYNLDRIEIDPLALKVEYTSVIIYHKQSKKDGIQPENLFEQFSIAIQNNPHNYLTLLSLELKDKLREDFSLIGNAFAGIDERAFFYHLNNYQDGEEYQLHLIHDFIIKSWIEDLIQHNYRRIPDVLNHVIEKIKGATLPSSPKEAKADNTLIEGLMRYSSFISTVNSERETPELQFGDIFLDQENSHFYLCITPHCDCLRPEKIQYNFYFIKGEKYDNVKALQEAETGYNSFVAQEKELTSIKWRCKPFTAHIQSNDIEELVFDYCSQKVRLNYLATLKENHVQRIANQSFGYGYRVGIELPHISK